MLLLLESLPSSDAVLYSGIDAVFASVRCEDLILGIERSLLVARRENRELDSGPERPARYRP
jgi:hypothetical protein